MVERRVPISAAQQRLGHTRPDILLKHYTHVLDQSAEIAAETLSSQLSGKKAKKNGVRADQDFKVNWQPNGSQSKMGDVSD
jgi:hypothetical protein